MKYDIKIYGIEERQENILHNKEILGLKDTDVFILKKEDRVTPQDKWPYKLCKKAFTSYVPEGVTHRLVLQDDVELAPGITKYLDDVINSHPDAIFMLTSLDFREKDEYADNLKTPYIKVGCFVSGCAVLIPIKYIKKMFTWFETKYPQIWIGNPHEDSAFKIYADTFRIECLTTIPSLVQHLGDVSTCCNYEQPLKTAYFDNWEKADWSCLEVSPAKFDVKKINEYLAKEQAISLDNSIHYFVRTTGERFFDYSPLQTRSLYDYKHDPVNSFISQLETIGKYNSVLLEDDVVLCKDFKNKIEEVIKQHPDSIINFFTDPDIWEETHLRDYPFEWNQCTYYPKGVGRVIAKKMKELKSKFPVNQKLYSQVLNRALYELGIPHLVYRPCLVQHLDNNSILGKDGRARRSIYFIDYLNELGIDYAEAHNPINKQKLISLMKDKFKDVDNK